MISFMTISGAFCSTSGRVMLTLVSVCPQDVVPLSCGRLMAVVYWRGTPALHAQLLTWLDSFIGLACTPMLRISCARASPARPSNPRTVYVWGLRSTLFRRRLLSRSLIGPWILLGLYLCHELAMHMSSRGWIAPLK